MHIVGLRELRIRDRRSVREAEDAFTVAIEVHLALIVADAGWSVHQEWLDHREADK
ncbi:hypothetical protein [Mesorhizobium sp.]|uniref:hypothetical protein n=1 Tax=Mesorhizobium sp. TaxID=1871066 RepID=UPI0025EE2B48|nr:hypothetical protein [Mesorhizobium sp.]